MGFGTARSDATGQSLRDRTSLLHNLATRYFRARYGHTHKPGTIYSINRETA